MRLIDADALTDNIEAAIIVYKRHAKFDKALLRQVDALKLELKIIKDAPTVAKDINVPAKRGRWKWHKAKGWEGGGVTRCTCCNYGYAWGAFFEVENFNFCPNCGARMEASDD